MGTLRALQLVGHAPVRESPRNRQNKRRMLMKKTSKVPVTRLRKAQASLDEMLQLLGSNLPAPEHRKAPEEQSWTLSRNIRQDVDKAPAASVFAFLS